MRSDPLSNCSDNNNWLSSKQSTPTGNTQQQREQPYQHHHHDELEQSQMMPSCRQRSLTPYVILFFSTLFLLSLLLISHTKAQANDLNDPNIILHSDSNDDMINIINKLLQKQREEVKKSTTFASFSHPREDAQDEEKSSQPPIFTHFFEGRSSSTPLNRRRLLYNLSTNSTSHSQTHPFPPMSQDQIEKNKLLLEEMFRHAYDAYMYNAFPWSELKPLSCGPGTFHLVRLPALTLIDTLDTLLVMGNMTEFGRSVERLRYHNNAVDGLFNVDQNVSVFETNIRVLGGLLSAHQMIRKIAPNVYFDDVFQSDVEGDSNFRYAVKIGPVVETERRSERLWLYDDFLLELAVDIGDRLMPAFNTQTGIPYGTVNLRKGVPDGETTVASLAGGGTLTLEFEMLTRLTGDAKYGDAAILATRALFLRRNVQTNLLGKHIDVQTGRWREARSGIGSNSDSFYEYLLKFYILFQKEDFWTMFAEVYRGVWKYVRTDEHWFGDVEMHMTGGNIKTHVFESLAAFWPGLLVLLGELAPAKTLLNAIFLAREELGFLPERFQYQNFRADSLLHKQNDVVGSGGKYPLRPELLESTYFLHRATKDGETSSWQWPADFSLHALEHLTRTECGYASVRRVTPYHYSHNSSTIHDYYNPRGIELEDEMPSYFLSETIKYLYLMFDEDNILHQETDHPFIFTTEAHPFHYVPDPRRFGSNEKWTMSTRQKQYYNAIKQIKLRGAAADTASSSTTKYFSPADDNLSRLLTTNNLQFHPRGSGEALPQHCPNYNHPRFGWVHALGLDGGLNYEEDYAERILRKQSMKPVPQQQAGVCEVSSTTSKTTKSFSAQQQYVPKGGERKGTSAILESGVEPVQLDMGESLGIVEVAMMTDGFYARHLNSDETIEVSLVTVPSTETGNDASFDTYLVIMTRRPTNGDIDKRVIFTDWNNNKFFCQVELYKKYGDDSEDDQGEDFVLDSYRKIKFRELPCTPAMFGPTVMSNLIATGGLRVEGAKIVTAPSNNKHACDKITFSSEDDTAHEEKTASTSHDHPIVQLIWRGKCAFEDKARNVNLDPDKDAVIIVNDETDHLFVMASNKGALPPQSQTTTNEDDGTNSKVPLSVLVGYKDGQFISKANNKSVEVVVRMEPDVAEWPKVTTAAGAMQILAANKWGIHVEFNPNANENNDGSDNINADGNNLMNWQLFVVSHNAANDDPMDEASVYFQ